MIMLKWFRKSATTTQQQTDSTLKQPDYISAEAYREAAEWANAEHAYRQVLQTNETCAEAWFGLGDSLYQQDRFADAEEALAKAIQFRGDVAEFHYKIGNALKDLERLPEAKAHYQRALDLDPNHARAHNNLGSILEREEQFDDAIVSYRKALDADPALLPALINIASLFSRRNRFEEAIRAYRDLLAIDNSIAPAWANLGEAYRQLGDLDRAVPAFRKALSLVPDFAAALLGLGFALVVLRQLEEATSIAHHLTKTAPEDPRGWFILGGTLQCQNKHQEALAAYQEGLALAPDNAELLNSVAAHFTLINELDTALRYFHDAIKIVPDNAMLWTNRGNTSLMLGYIENAIADYRHALTLEPNNVNAARYLLTALLYVPTSPEVLFKEHVAFGERFSKLAKSAAPYLVSPPTKHSKIRVGYLSSDFRTHPVAFNMRPLIAQHDRSQFEIYLYFHSMKPDHMTDWFSQHCDQWRPIPSLTDEAVAQIIRQDEIDILVILASRFDSNRPLVAAYRAAPVQVSLHDPGTSGLWDMDYLIADANLVPHQSAEHFTERVARLPTFYLHEPIQNAPDVAPLPALSNGYVTFGSFNNPSKINTQTVATWARVLRAVPNSRLILKYWDTFNVPSIRERYRVIFEQEGVSFDRVQTEFQTMEARDSHLARYARVDIALDPYPFTGSTTTFEALWLGVPVVTLAGYNMAARWSTSMLKKVGLTQCIAHSEAEYIEIAKTLATDLNRLAQTRTGLRERVANSPLCAVDKRTRQVERLYRYMWAKHLSRQTTPYGTE